MTGAADFIPAGAGIDRLRAAARACTGCPLHEGTTQTVFSKGPVAARLVFVGEQPGDIEDRRGEPFVGPAGKLLDRAVDAAGLDPARHLHDERGEALQVPSERVRSTPDPLDSRCGRCRGLSAVVARGVRDPLARGRRCSRCDRGEGVVRSGVSGDAVAWAVDAWPSCAEQPADFGHDGDDGAPSGAFAMATIHPSAVLRAEDQEVAFNGLVSDLKIAASALIA